MVTSSLRVGTNGGFQLVGFVHSPLVGRKSEAQASVLARAQNIHAIPNRGRDITASRLRRRGDQGRDTVIRTEGRNRLPLGHRHSSQAVCTQIGQSSEISSHPHVLTLTSESTDIEVRIGMPFRYLTLNRHAR